MCFLQNFLEDLGFDPLNSIPTNIKERFLSAVSKEVREGKKEISNYNEYKTILKLSFLIYKYD